MAASAANRVSKVGEREICGVRVFDAPADLVWKVWTEPEHIVQWWGPRGWSLITRSMDLRPGGRWSFVMHGPDGRESPNEITFTEVVKPVRIAYHHASTMEDKTPKFDVTIDFVEENGKTTMTWRSFLSNEAERDMVADKFGAIQGLAETLERMEQRVAYAAGGPQYHISRTFDAPRELVWKAWTDPESLAKWWGPKQYPTTVVRMDVRPGGEMLYYMTAPDGQKLWGKFLYREIVPPAKLIYSHSFSNAEGGFARHPFISDWPAKSVTTVTFTEEAGKTTLTVHGVPFCANDAERAAFQEGLPMMTAGFGSSFEKLAEFLAG